MEMRTAARKIELISEEKEKKNMSPKLNGAVHSSVKSDYDNTLLDLMHRVLPPTPETTQAAPPAPQANDPMYDSVEDLQERLAKRQQSGKKDDTTFSTSNNMTTVENQEPQKLDRINPLYESADEVQVSPSNPETTPKLHGQECVRNEHCNAVNEPLYARIRKDPSVKRPPPQNPGGEQSNKDVALPIVVLQEKLNSDEQRVDLIASMEQKEKNVSSPGDKVNSMLTHWNKRSIKSAKPRQEATTVTGTQDAPPLVPAKRFEIESEAEEHIIEEDTD
ncbi:uncharacterized protein LOC142295757 [Anomaloglossus baeobatrachus]|uniref:uncharacterized protein LOC142295757 n=1 Tax=Anomaloglossus baeobatrachus TaxID=238106 RepID=UPI003F504F6D